MVDMTYDELDCGVTRKTIDHVACTFGAPGDERCYKEVCDLELYSLM